MNAAEVVGEVTWLHAVARPAETSLVGADRQQGRTLGEGGICQLCYEMLLNNVFMGIIKSKVLSLSLSKRFVI